MPRLVIGNSRAISTTDKREAALYCSLLTPVPQGVLFGAFHLTCGCPYEKLPEVLWSLFRTRQCTGLNIFLNVGLFLCLNR